MIPEYGHEELIGQQSERLTEQSEGLLPQEREDAPERELDERDREDRELQYLNPEDNEAHAPGQVCGRCGAVITARQDVRLGQTTAGCTRYVRRPRPVSGARIARRAAGSPMVLASVASTLIPSLLSTSTRVSVAFTPGCS